MLDFAYDTPTWALALFRRTALVDLDPGLLQLWMSQGKLQVSEHDVNFTIGETVGTSEARFPDCGLSWHHTPSPVFLPAWPATEAAGGPYTTVTNWWEGWIELDDRPICNDKRHARSSPTLSSPRGQSGRSSWRSRSTTTRPRRTSPVLE